MTTKSIVLSLQIDISKYIYIYLYIYIYILTSVSSHDFIYHTYIDQRCEEVYTLKGIPVILGQLIHSNPNIVQQSLDLIAHLAENGKTISTLSLSLSHTQIN